MITYPRSLTGNEVMISFAQNKEDVLIDRVFRKKSGFFIDVGGFHPVADSVTKYFSLVGWRGINIEPDAAGIADFQRDRPSEINLQCVIGRERGTATFYQLQNKGMSTISTAQLAMLSAAEQAGARPVTVEMRTLADVCAEFVTGEIDFLKIDVEGAEEDVLRGADWQRFRPRLLVIEATKPMSSEPNCAAWEPYLLSQGYLLAHCDGINRHYLRREDEALAEQLSVPVNVLDVFMTWREFSLQRALDEVQQELLRLRRTMAGPGLQSPLIGATFSLPTAPQR